MEQVFKVRIRELRTKAGMTQKQIAEKAKISVTSYSAYEQGAKLPPLEIAVKIAEAFNVSLDWLCGLKVTAAYAYPESFGDLIKVFVGLSFSDLQIEITEEIVEGLITKYDPRSFDTLGNVHKAVFKCADTDMAKFFKDWSDVYRLYKEKTIPDDMYALWVNDQIKRHQETPIQYTKNDA